MKIHSNNSKNFSGKNKMVYAEYRNNVDEYKRFCAFHLLYARGIRSYIFSVFFCLLAILFVVMAAITSNALLYVGAAVLLIVAIALPLLGVWAQNGKINKRIRQDDSFVKATQSFLFSESGIHLTVRSRGKSEEYDIPYTRIPRIFERKDVYYIYIGATQALIVRKADIREDVPGELRGYFRTLGKRYRTRGRIAADDEPHAGENL